MKSYNLRNNNRGQLEYLALGGLIIALGVYAYYQFQAARDMYRSWREK